MIQAASNIKLVTAKNADTTDIIAALKAAAPIAAKQLKKFVSETYKAEMSPRQYADIVAAYIQKNYRYLKDGYEEQIIQLPSQLNSSKAGDCKSFSLFFAGAMSAARIKNGFKFVSYREGGKFTHVYNFIEVDGKQYFYDTCISPPNRELPSKKSALMNVAILGEPAGIGRRRRRTRAERREDREERQERRQERKQERKEGRKERKETRRSEGRRPFRRVALAPGRGAFLLLVSLNVRNWAKRLGKMNPKDVEAFWKRLGGKPEKLFQAIRTGSNKPRLLGVEEDYLGDPATATAALATAAPIVLALIKFFKSKGLKEEEDQKVSETLKAEGAEDLTAGFAVEDPEPGSVQESRGASDPRYSGPVGRTAKESESSSNTPLLIGGAALLALLLLKK